MFISWRVISWGILTFPIFLWFFFSLESPFIIWFFLELGVWGLFFFFLGGGEEEKSKNAIRFFIIQGLCSLLWIRATVSGNEIFNSLIPLVIFLKIGLAPGHFWAWKIYERGNLYLIWFISTFLKFIPLGIIYSSLSGGGLSFFFFKILIIANLFLRIYVFSLEMNFNLFLLASRILHFNNMSILILNEKLLETCLYFIFYSVTLFFGIIRILNFEKALSSPESGEPLWGTGNWMVVSLSLVGFPPRLIFLVKIIFLMNMGEVVNSFFFLRYSVIFLIYLIVLISSFIRYVHFSNTLESNFSWELWKKKFSFKKIPLIIIINFSFLFYCCLIFSLLVLEKKN